MKNSRQRAGMGFALCFLPARVRMDKLINIVVLLYLDIPMELSKTLTLHPEKRRGYVMPSDLYDEIKTFIISSLQEDEEVLFKDLIDLAYRNFMASAGNIAWYLLIVKLDLEAREIISCSIGAGLERNQVLRIKRKKVGKKRSIYG